jgi:hypothetical protein
MNRLQLTLFKILKCTNIQVQPEVLNIDVILRELKDRMILSAEEVEKIHEEVKRSI